MRVDALGDRQPVSRGVCEPMLIRSAMSGPAAQHVDRCMMHRRAEARRGRRTARTSLDESSDIDARAGGRQTYPSDTYAVGSALVDHR
jgi:hypothetical protein